jgi:hypothetical protein
LEKERHRDYKYIKVAYGVEDPCNPWKECIWDAFPFDERVPCCLYRCATEDVDEKEDNVKDGISDNSKPYGKFGLLVDFEHSMIAQKDAELDRKDNRKVKFEGY